MPSEPHRHPRCRHLAVRRTPRPRATSRSAAARAARAAAERPSPSRSASVTDPRSLSRSIARCQRRWLSASSAGVNRLTSGLSGRGRHLAASSKKGASGSAAACLSRVQDRRVRLRAMLLRASSPNAGPRRRAERWAPRDLVQRRTGMGPESGTSITRPAAPKPILGSSIALNAHALTATAPDPERYGQ